MSDEPTTPQTYTARVKALLSGNEGTMFDVNGLPVSFETNTAVTLSFGFFESPTKILELIYAIYSSSVYTWASAGPTDKSLPPSNTIIGTFVLTRGGTQVYSKDITFADCDNPVMSIADFSGGVNHATVEIPATVFNRNGTYSARIDYFSRWYRTFARTTWAAYDWSSNWLNATTQTLSLGKISVSGENSEDEETNVPISRKVRVAFDSSTYDIDATDILRSDILKVYSGNATTFQIGLFTNGEIPSDIMGVATSIEFVIKDTGGDWYPDADGGAVLKREIRGFAVDLTKENWNAKTHAHAEINFTSEEMSLTPGVRWLCVDVVSGDSRITFYAGRIYVVDNGVTGRTLVDILEETKLAAQEAKDARDMMLALVNEQTNPTALFDRVISQLNSALVTSGNRIFIGEDRGLYMRDENEGGDGLYHKLELVRVEGQLMLTPNEEGVENV